MKAVGPKTERGQQEPYMSRMPKKLVEDFFGEQGVPHKSEQSRDRAARFVARQLEVKPEQVRVTRRGYVVLDKKATRQAYRRVLKDESFVPAGGKSAALYEGLEMAYNDIISGTVQAGGPSFLGRLKKTAGSLLKALPKRVRHTFEALQKSGAMAWLAGAGAGTTVGLGLWLAKTGAKEIKQGLARGDRDQTFSGARHAFLGVESLATGTVLAGSLSKSAMVKTAATVARRVALPLALVHGVIDVAQGVHHIRQGAVHKESLSVVEGLAELGMGFGWVAAAFGATPLIVGVSCACLATKIGVSVLKSRRDEKDKQEQRALDHEVIKNQLPTEDQSGKNEINWTPPPEEEATELTAQS